MTGVPKVARMEEQVRFSDRANSRDTIPIRPTTNQVLCPQNTKCEKGPQLGTSVQKSG